MTLPILLASDAAPTVCHRRCIAHPLKKRCVICASPVLDRAADMTMILAYHKLSDTVADSRGFKRFGARIGRFFFRRGYKKAAVREAEFDVIVRENLAELAALESTLTAADHRRICSARTGTGAHLARDLLPRRTLCLYP